MKLFEEKPVVHRYEYAAEFIRDFQVGEGDFILAGKSAIRASMARESRRILW